MGRRALAESLPHPIGIEPAPAGNDEGSAAVRALTLVDVDALSDSNTRPTDWDSIQAGAQSVPSISDHRAGMSVSACSPADRHLQIVALSVRAASPPRPLA